MPGHTSPFQIMIFGCIAGLLLVDSKYGGRRCQLLAVRALGEFPWGQAEGLRKRIHRVMQGSGYFDSWL